MGFGKAQVTLGVAARSAAACLGGRPLLYGVAIAGAMMCGGLSLSTVSSIAAVANSGAREGYEAQGAPSMRIQTPGALILVYPMSSDTRRPTEARGCSCISTDAPSWMSFIRDTKFE